MNRRQFLRASGWTAGGLTMFSVSGCGLLPALPSFGGSSMDDAFAWVKVTPDGVVQFLLPRAELGQGIDTGLTQVVAEELQLAPQLINCVYQRTDQMAPCQMTVGSQSIENYLMLTATAAAALRAELVARASLRLGADVNHAALQCRDGGVHHAGGVLTFSELVSDNEDEVIPVEAAQTLERLSLRNTGRYVGQAVRAARVEEIVKGGEAFSRDITLPGMVFGGVAHPAQIGASLQAFDVTSAAKVSGVVEVVQGPQGSVGVVAETPMAVAQGLRALDCVWAPLAAKDEAELDQLLDVDKCVRNGQLEHEPISTGDLEAGRRDSRTEINVRYDTPMAAHAAMEPRSGVARPQGDGLEIWTGSQDPWYVRQAVSKALGVSSEEVVVHNCRVGGAFGGRLHCQASFEAAWLAKAVNRPVKVQWSREDEFRHNYVGPQFSTRIEAGLSAEGKISFWRHQMVGAPVLTTSMLVPPGLHWLANIPADPGTIRGTETAYDMENHLVETADVRVPMPTGPWRGLGAAPNTFAVECAMDELALAGKLDPIELRTAHARNPRLIEVLRRLASLTETESHIGVAATAYKGVTFVGIAAKVVVEAGRPRVSKLWCVHDCGRLISPDRVRAQVEGNLIWGISMALHERFELSGGIAVTDNFDRYPIARQLDIPELEIELLRSDADPSGAAEAALAPAAAAIANAYARTERRRRSLPLT